MHATASDISSLPFDLASTRQAQERWAETPLSRRLDFVRRLRALIAEQAEELAAEAALVRNRPASEKLMSEVLPLADACRWLGRKSSAVLASKRFGRRWPIRARFQIQRQSFGIILVVGPGNYPLFLPAVHTLQALVAGNAVLWKPAPDTRAVALRFAEMTRAAGLEPALLRVLHENVAAAHESIQAGVDKVVFTGASANGRDLLATLAKTNTPSVMELSGDDAFIVLADADMKLVERAHHFGVRLNDGDTCIAPRRVIVQAPVAEAMRSLLPSADFGRLQLHRVEDSEEAIRVANANAHGLGAAIFSRDIALARRMARRLQTGFVTINDLIAPTADARAPFGGVKASGFGSTRGADGLLEMTHPHVVFVGRSRMHFRAPQAKDAALFRSFIRVRHARPVRRFRAFLELLGQIPKRAGSGRKR
jgi:acyl-CoA reductase-like NAD-dependent aldehyde dehydrogenase